MKRSCHELSDTDDSTLRVWRSRGYLPHYDQPGLTQFITFRLADSLPKEAILRKQDRLSAREQAIERERIELVLDLGHGNCILGNQAAAKLVEESLLADDGRTHKLIAWVIMPNHVHVVTETMPETRLATLVQSWKGTSSLKVNRLIGRSGALWQREYFDRYIRDEDHLIQVVEYIEWNPVKAGLCVKPADWPFSSARLWERAG